jgi:cation transport regulator ChaC
MYEREKKEMQETAYYDNRYALAMLEAGKIKEYIHYLKTSRHRLISGMAVTEIEAVEKRAIDASNEE